MDTTYIKMCDCEEIQELKYGHVMQSCHMDNHIDPVMGVWITQRGEYYTGYYLGLKEERIIWLPRQDQLQEIYGNEDPQIIAALFNDEINLRFRRHDYYQQFISMEQLWLAFIMRELHNKVWLNGDWIKEAENV